MNRLLPALAALTVLFFTPLRAADTPAKPNVVLIFIDDMGYGDIGPFGSTKNRTPNLDRMAKEGMKLTSFYAAPVCSVSRAQVITGCYGQRVSLPGVLFPGAPTGISAKEHTVAELMKAQGYATMCIGKWHLGDQPVFLPTRHGFDHYFGIPYSNDMLKPAKVNGQRVVPLVRDEKVQELLLEDDQDGITARYTDEAVKFVTENKSRQFSSTCRTTRGIRRFIRAQNFAASRRTGASATGSRKWTGAWGASSTRCANSSSQKTRS